MRIKHPESGVIVTGQNSKSRKANMKDALNSLANHYRFKLWCELKSSLDYKVTSMMKDVKVEKYVDGKWVEI